MPNSNDVASNEMLWERVLSLIQALGRVRNVVGIVVAQAPRI